MKNLFLFVFSFFALVGCEPTQMSDPASGFYNVSYDVDDPAIGTAFLSPTGYYGWSVNADDIDGAIANPVAGWWFNSDRTEFYIAYFGEVIPRKYSVISETVAELRLYGFSEGMKFVYTKIQ